MALKTGVADACEMDLPSFLNHHLYETVKYLILTGHVIQAGHLTLNKPFLDSLSKKHKEIVLKAGEEATTWGTDYMKRNEIKFFIDLQKLGMQVIVPDAKAFIDKAKPAIENLFETEWPVATWKEIASY